MKDADEIFEVAIEIGGVAETLEIARLPGTLDGHHVYSVHLAGACLGKVWQVLSEGQLCWASTDLIGGEILRLIGQAIERHYV